MNNRFSSEEEFFEDFGEARLSDEEVQEILESARKSSDVKLRRLAKEVQFLRLLSADLLEILEKTSKDNQVLELARLIRSNSNSR